MRGRKCWGRVCLVSVESSDKRCQTASPHWESRPAFVGFDDVRPSIRWVEVFPVVAQPYKWGQDPFEAVYVACERELG